MQILSSLAEVMLEEGAADGLACSDAEHVYRVLGGGASGERMEE